MALGLVAQALALDAWLISHRHEPISTCVRASIVGKALTAYLAAHLVATIPGDPLSLLCSRYQQRLLLVSPSVHLHSTDCR